MIGHSAMPRVWLEIFDAWNEKLQNMFSRKLSAAVEHMMQLPMYLGREVE